MLPEWDLTSLPPNQSLEFRIAVVDTDSKGRPKRFHFGKTRLAPLKETTVYYEDEELPSNVKPDYAFYAEREGQWVMDSQGTVAQVQRIYGDKFFATSFGLNSRHEASPIFLRPRRRFGDLRASVDKGVYVPRFTIQHMRYIEALVIARFDLVRAYMLATGKPPPAYKTAQMRAIRALSCKEAKEFLMQTIQSELTNAGITPKAWIQKLITSADGPIKNAVQLNMWMTIGKFIPEVREALLEANGEEMGGGKGAAFGTQGQMKDAEFKDVCKVCDGKKKISVTGTSPESGQPATVEINCPACGGVPELPKAVGGLRV
jgi:hypothetical protein